MRHNELVQVAEVSDLIRDCVDLETVAVLDGNKFLGTKQKLRQDMLMHSIGKLSKLCISNGACPLWQFEDEEITVEEVLQLWKRSQSSTSMEEAMKMDQYRFECAVYNKYLMHFVQQDEDTAFYKHTMVWNRVTWLNLSHCQLQYVNVQMMMQHVKRLSLRNNQLTEKHIYASGLLSENVVLEELDLQDNHIRELNCLIQLLNALPALRNAWFHNNDCYHGQTNNNERLQLLGKCKHICDAAWKLQTLDGHKMSLQYKCEALEASQSDMRIVEQLRMQLYLQSNNNNNATKMLHVSGIGLRLMDACSQFTQLEALDLSNNRIQELDMHVFVELRALHTLDLRNNELTNMVHTLMCLCVSHSLRVLHLDKAGAEFAHGPEHYVLTFFRSMRSLDMIDQVMNPCPLNTVQRQAVLYLQQQYGISPNGLMNIDLTERRMEKGHFWATMLALECLVDEHVSNPFLSASNTVAQVTFGPYALKMKQGNNSNCSANF